MDFLYLLVIPIFVIVSVFLTILIYYWIKQINYGLNPKRMVFVPTFLNQEIKDSLKKIIKELNLDTSKIELWEPGCGMAGTSIWLQKQFTFASCIGIEIDRLTLIMAKINRWLNKSSIQLIKQDFFELKPTKNSLIYCYLGQSLMTQLYKTGFFEGCVVISLTFGIKDVIAKQTISLNPIHKKIEVYDFRKA